MMYKWIKQQIKADWWWLKDYQNKFIKIFIQTYCLLGFLAAVFAFFIGDFFTTLEACSLDSFFFVLPLETFSRNL